MHYITFNDDKTTITNIDDIYKIENPTNVKKLDLSWNNLTEFNKDIFSNLTQLQILDLSHNNLTELHKDIFSNLTQLQDLFLCYNKINKLDKNIFSNLTQLEYLSVGHNKLTEIDKYIFSNFTQLQILNLQNNTLTELHKDIFSNLTQLLQLDFSNNNLTKLDKDIFSNLIQLQDLVLDDNNLTELDKDIFSNLTQLQDLYLSNNNLTSIPSSITRCYNLIDIDYSDNEINYIPPNIQRFLDNIYQQTNHLQIYNDSQNVHNHSIQESIKISLENILNVPKQINKAHLIDHLIENNHMNEKSKRLLLEYCQDASVHTVLNITFEESLLHVLEFINQKLLEHKKEILKILEIEILDSYCKCFTGRISRLINCLNGFTELVQITIPDNMGIFNVIIMIKNNYKGDNVEELKEIITKELLDRGYLQDKINEYIDYVEI
jgi:Leucine-rich repeat (LRR) protein